MACDLWMTYRSRRSERGFVLITVLIFAALLTSLLLGILEMSSSYMFSAAAYSAAARADELGRTAADLVAQQTLSRDPNAKRGGSFVVHLKGADVFVDYLSETARIDVNAGQPELLVALFKAAGIEPAEAEAIGERIKAFRASAASSNDQQPPLTNASQAKPNAPTLIEYETQIADAWDMSPEAMQKVTPYLTVANPSGKVDPLLAHKLVIEAVFGDEMRADDFMRQRARGFASETGALQLIPLGARGYVDFSPAKAFRAEVRVHLINRVERRYQMVVVPPQKHGDSVQVTAWEAL